MPLCESPFSCPWIFHCFEQPTIRQHPKLQFINWNGKLKIFCQCICFKLISFHVVILVSRTGAGVGRLTGDDEGKEISGVLFQTFMSDRSMKKTFEMDFEEIVKSEFRDFAAQKGNGLAIT